MPTNMRGLPRSRSVWGPSDRGISDEQGTKPHLAFNVRASKDPEDTSRLSGLVLMLLMRA